MFNLLQKLFSDTNINNVPIHTWDDEREDYFEIIEWKFFFIPDMNSLEKIHYFDLLLTLVS